MNKINDRINKIKTDHETLLKMVRESILQNKDNLTKEVTKALEIVDFDQKNIKKYEAVMEAQELITTLTQEILNCTTSEDILVVRNKLNYYINKIKTILKNRNISDTAIEAYQAKVSYLRKDISKYIRFLKRENNISLIDNLYANYDNLSVEELKTFKKALTLENNYNNRNLNPTEKKENQTKKKASPVENTKPTTDTTINKDITKTTKVSTSSNINVTEYFNKSTDSFNSIYNIADTYDYYQNNPKQNIVNFCRNIPRYIHNKKAYKLIQNDYDNYYRGSDLASYMAYVKQRNSIYRGLKCIFKRSYLYNQDAMYLNNHEKCSSWLLNFCQTQSLELPIQSYNQLSLNRN